MSINKEMNILIVGNGFDLAHYLPTKYDHFMGVMQEVEDWDISKGDMQFDDLFKSFYEREAWFFGYTKAMYKTEEVKLTVSQIEKLQKQLKENVWYQYFSDHVKELKTWIDFETKIDEALEACCEFFDKYNLIKLSCGDVLYTVFGLGNGFKDAISIQKKHRSILVLLKVIDKISLNSESLEYVISQRFDITIRDDREFNYSKCLNFLHSQLENFIELFNIYLVDCIQSLSVEKKLEIPEQIGEVHQIFSFNYTDTFNRFYYDVPTDFLHGKCGDSNKKIVLGIADLSHEILKKYKAYGFVKYHQKLMNGTDYKFILENNRTANIIESINRGMNAKKLDIVFWGHSLDVSDENYMKEIFSLNDEKDMRVRVIVYFYDANAKFSMLANLIHILGNHKVERWMKKGWLKFEPVPNIAEINKVEPVSLKI